MIYIFLLKTIRKHVTNFHDKTEYVIHTRNIKQALNHGLVLEKLHRIITFNQKAWLKLQGRCHCMGGWSAGAPWPIHFNFQIKQVPTVSVSNTGVLLYRGVIRTRNYTTLYGPEMSQFLPYILQFLDNLWWLYIFFKYIGETDYFRLDLRKRSNT